jgi:uncharacterized protein (DUF927 family)
VAEPCVGNSRLVFSISTAFAPPLLELVGTEGGGVHIKGASSIGKSTAGAVAGSVWGGGGLRGWAQSWRATDNGLEAVAAAHSDLLLVLDEMGEVSGAALGAAAYMLANGRGKARAGRDGGRRRSTEWRLVFLSTGEVGLADKLAEDGRRPRRAMAGQEVRVVDLPADAGRGLGLFDRLPPGITSARAFADRLRAAAAARYGTAGPAFLEFLVAEPDAVAEAVLGAQREFVAAHADGAAGQVARVAARFGLIAAAGELAAGSGIVPWAPGEAARAAARCFADWVATRPGGAGPGEDAAALRQVRAFIEAHGASRFEALAGQEGAPEEARPVPNRAGFRRQGEGGAWEYLILSEAWRTEVCRGLDPIAAAKAVDAAGFLRRGGDGRLQDKPSISGHGSPRVYVVRGAILGGDAVEAPRSAGAPA